MEGGRSGEDGSADGDSEREREEVEKTEGNLFAEDDWQSEYVSACACVHNVCVCVCARARV